MTKPSKSCHSNVVTKKRRLAYLALITTAIIWGSTGAVAKGTFSALNPAQFLYFRYLLATLISFPYLIYLLIKLKPKLKTLWSIILLEGLAIPLPLLMLYEGVYRTSAVEASLIGATSPIFTVLGGIIFLRERETRREWQGLAISFLGTLILVAEPLLMMTNGTITYSLSGNLMVIGYNIFWTLYCLLAKKLYKKIPKVLVTALAFPIYAIIFTLYILISHNPLPSLSILTTSSHLSISMLYMVVMSSFIAGTLYIWGQDKIEASEASVFTYLQGIVAIPVAFLLLGETPSPIAYLAIIVIALGVYRAESRVNQH